MNPKRQGPPDHAKAHGFRRRQEEEGGGKGRGERVKKWVDRAKENGRGRDKDPEKREAAREIVREKKNKIKEARRERRGERREERQERRSERREERRGERQERRSERREERQERRDQRPASTSTGGTSQASPAQKDAERRMGPPAHAKAYGYRRKHEGGEERPAPGGPSSGPMADQAAKREEFKARMMERRAAREREKGEPDEDREGRGRGRGRGRGNAYGRR